MAAFQGKNSPEWAGPKDQVGSARFWIYQYNRPVDSLAQALASGEAFTVVWYYEPSEKEVAAGMTERTMMAEVFGPNSSYIGILGRMYKLRRQRLTTLRFTTSPEGYNASIDDFL